MSPTIRNAVRSLRRAPGLGIAASYAVAFVFAVLLYVSVLLHELAHSVLAKAYGLPVRRITLYLLGGVSEIEKEPPTPGKEFMVAAAGPVLSLGLAADVRVDRPRRHARQRRDGGRVRPHESGARVPVVAGRAPRC